MTRPSKFAPTAVSPARRYGAALVAGLGLGVVVQLLGVVFATQGRWMTWGERLWFALWGLIALMAALAPWLYRYAPRWAGWLPYAAAAVFLGMTIPGMFSVGVHMLLAGLLDLAAGVLLAPSWRRVGLTLVAAAALTAGILGWVLTRW